ncbi:reverse transcriptase family protein [Qipengyuania sp. XHP0207]|uniref:reverse transcriptase family protein n=1 Tax=Qipengyuania sp. XHP0207 TaxID=3038078 RepID=UPI00241D7B97|nr:reverse transcriptase family protein [Qipengyuania sp. XHP0207]MDG5746698.1 reverse transcriptase family protein [Qipengyuania sp. XHP0207]
MKKPFEPYPLHQCALYRLKSRRQLASRLNRSLPYISSRAAKPELYREWREPKRSGGTRLIEAPRPDLKELQRRIGDLLQRVAPPDYLFSPVKGKSYLENAFVHKSAKTIKLLDIDDYFGNCLAKSVYAFFRQHLRCEPDVAHLLTGLTCRNGHLPQGSPASPILSFYSAFDMWNEIQTLVVAADCKMSLYVDDITISGEQVPEALVFEVKGVLHRHGHNYSKRKEGRRHGRPAEVTGLMVGSGKAMVPHRHYRKLLDARLAASTTADEEERARAIARAKSLEYQVQAVSKKKRQ